MLGMLGGLPPNGLGHGQHSGQHHSEHGKQNREGLVDLPQVWEIFRNCQDSVKLQGMIIWIHKK